MGRNPATRVRAEFVGPRTHAVLASAVLVLITAWGIAHLISMAGVFAATANRLAFTWMLAFLLLSWVPLSWFERPIRADREGSTGLERLRVTVQVPVYNEDPAALRSCLFSVLEQTRPVTRVRVVDDGSQDPGGKPIAYDSVRADVARTARAQDIEFTWDRTENRGKRWAQMHVLADDDADIFVTLDSDSVLDRNAVREGLQPFADPQVQSVAGLVAVLNNKVNALTWLTSVLYLPFTRGWRSAQSVLRRVTINSGTLAFYRAEVVRKRAGAYENERFCGRPMQMNDDSMLTFYALLDGDTVHQPSAVAFTLVPQTLRHYFKQQMRWMRGTTVRHFWWLRYMPVRGVVFTTAVAEYVQLLLAVLVPVAVLVDPVLRAQWRELLTAAAIVGVALHYLMSLRLFVLRRSDDGALFTAVTFLLSPVAAMWRLVVLRPLYLYSVLTCRRIGRWGTRDDVEVKIPHRFSV